MKKLLLVIGIICFASYAYADKGLESSDVLVPFAYENLTITSTAQSLTSGTYNPASGKAKRAIMTCDFGSVVRYRNDGTAPTATSGHLLATGIIVVWAGDTAIGNASIIISRATNCPCQVTYER